jgi:hypothetical protein
MTATEAALRPHELRALAVATAQVVRLGAPEGETNTVPIRLRRPAGPMI